MMAVHLGAGHAARVLELLGEMQARSLPVGSVHYNLALRACAIHAQLPRTVNRIEEIYAELRAAGLRLDTRTLLALDGACKMHGRHDLSVRLRRERSLRTGA